MTGSPVSSATIVWKLSSASSRPWLISAWYGRVRRVPGRVLEHVALDDAGRDRGGVAHADQAGARRVGVGERRAGRRGRRPPSGPAGRSSGRSMRIARRDGLVEQLVERAPRRGRRACGRGRRRSDRCGGRRTRRGWSAGRGEWAWWAPMRVEVLGSPRCHRYLRVSPGAVAGLSPSASPLPGERTAFQRCLARPVRWPERFRGRLLLRRRSERTALPDGFVSGARLTRAASAATCATPCIPS